MRKQILFIHSAGTQGPEEGSSFLVPYLESVLGDDFEIIHPMMPAPNRPDYQEWRTKLDKELARIKDNAILIGHSLGGSVLLKYLTEEKIIRPFAGLFIISAPCWGEDGWESEDFEMGDTLLAHADVPQINLYHSVDDEVVPVRHLKYYAARIKGAITHEVSGYGHLFFDGFPELADDIKNLNMQLW